MKTLWELTRGIAKIVDILLYRMNKVEEGVVSQEQRLSEMDQKLAPQLHSMEVRQLQKFEQEKERHDVLSDNELRRELKSKYGTTKWARSLINSLILGRRGKSESRH